MNPIKYIKIMFLSLLIYSATSTSILVSGQVAGQDSARISSKSVAYGIQPLWKISSSISSVSGEELEKSIVPNLANRLAGRINGLTVRQTNGEPGYDSPTLNIRGVNTFGSGSSILILIDGFEAPIDQLSPLEIESVEVLKDASATAMYGNRAANGVLLVTTKRGMTGPLKVNFNAIQGIHQMGRMPEFLGSYDYARLYNEGLLNDGLPEYYTTEDLEAYRTGSDPIFYPDVNWHDEVLRKTSSFSNYGLTFTGGNERVKYFGLVNSMASNGLLIKAGDLSEFSKNSKYSRINFRTNIDIELSDRFSTTFLIGGTIEDKSNPGNSESTDGIFDLIAAIPPNVFPVYASKDLFGGSNVYTNPLGNVLKTGYYTSNGRTLNTAAKFTQQLDFITSGLSASAAISFNTYFRSYSSKSRTYKRFAVSKDALGNKVMTGIGQETSLSGNESLSDQWRNFTVQGFLNYDRVFGIHDISAVLLANTDQYVVTGSDLAFKHAGYAGRFTYTNSSKYIGEFTFGYNGTENFPKGSRMGFFPAGSVAWIMTNEDFLRGNSVLSFLKIKGSYGLVGNADIGGQRFMYDQYWGGVGSYYFGTANTAVSTIAEGIIANPDVTWEKEKRINIGLEAIVRDRISFSLDVFRHERSDILTKPYLTVPQYLGLTIPDLNMGKVSVRGFEASLKFESSINSTLQYYAELNTWFARSKIIYNSEALQVNEYLYRTGRTVGQPFVLEAIGFFKDATDIQNSPRQIFTDVRPGDIKYKDQNSDGIIDQYDYFPIGYPTLPEFTGGLHSGLRFKGFDLDIFFHGVTNRSVYLSGSYFHAFQNNAKVTSYALGRWTPETASSATYPRLSASNNMNNFQPSSFWQRDGSFIKLRSLELGYSIPKSLTSRIMVSSARVFINGTNLFSIDHMDGLTDPEILTQYPSTRNYSLGLKLQF